MLLAVRLIVNLSDLIINQSDKNNHFFKDRESMIAREQVRTVLSTNLKKLRKRRGWSQMKLAEQADISTNYLSEIERCLKWPFPETLQNLAKALNVKVYELFQDDIHTDNDHAHYKRRFSHDIEIAVEQAVSKAIHSVRKQYKV